MKRLPKHIVIPSLLLIYLAVMVGVFGMRVYRAGDYAHFFIVTGESLVVIVLIFFIMRARHRRDNDRNLDEIHNRR